MEDWKNGLLRLSRHVLESWFSGEEPDYTVRPEWMRKGATFVTLTKNKELRGCIGSTHAYEELYKNVIRNTLNAAFNDPRFPPLSRSELPEIKIEISILSEPKELEFSNENELLGKIRGKGVIIEKDGKSALFLPQVWEQLPDPQEFMENLCWKAGLEKDCWKSAKIHVFEVESFSE